MPRASKRTAAKAKPVDEDENASPKKKTKTEDTKKTNVKSSKNGKKAKVLVEDDSSNETVKTIVVKGKAPVDSECTSKIGKAHVYFEGDDIYDAMLNQTNLQHNNNKYFILQLLEDDKKKSYDVWFRWGRVGKKGQNSLKPCGSNLEMAKKTFCQKFQDKTRNNWEDREDFEKIEGKYDLVKLDYSTSPDELDGLEAEVTKKLKEKQADIKKKKIESKLHQSLQNLIELICSMKTMEETVMEMKYDTKKAPLGKLTEKQILAGYSALKKIEECILKHKPANALLKACNEFYTKIPHDFGMKKPPLINTVDELKLKTQLLEALGDIQVALKVIKMEDQEDSNPVDRQYGALNCNLRVMDKSEDMYKIITEYLENTHAPTHSAYTLDILDVFECDKEEEKSRFNDVGNKVLLWHGSRLCNWAGILSQGLRIAPPEAPVTGYMFGKGIYFADMCSKSANYCYPNTDNVGLLLLCEVSLGESNELKNADYNAEKLPKGKHSVAGLGRIAPASDGDKILDDGVKVPLGKQSQTGVTNAQGYTLNYNEYVVYNPDQVKMRYILKLKFNYKY